MLRKVISGGQTGADFGFIHAAKHLLGLETGGWLPKGCCTDEGTKRWMLAEYGMQEHPSWQYPPRTEANVREADGTCIVGNVDSPGCSLTVRLCKRHGKPYIVNPSPAELRQWVEANHIEVLNGAGNRERTNPGIFSRTVELMVAAFKG